LVRGNGVTCSLEDVVKPKGVSLEDDCGDSLRYAVAGVLLDEGEKPKEQKLREKLAGIKDPFRRHVEQFRAYNEEQACQRKANMPTKTVPTWMKRFQK